MKLFTRQAGLRAAIFSTLLVCAAAAQAAGGFMVQPAQESLVKVGMTRAEVRSALGRPAHNMKYRAEPGRTWTYGIVGEDSKVFDVDFSADGRVASTSERVEMIE